MLKKKVLLIQLIYTKKRYSKLHFTNVGTLTVPATYYYIITHATYST